MLLHRGYIPCSPRSIQRPAQHGLEILLECHSQGWKTVPRESRPRWSTRQAQWNTSIHVCRWFDLWTFSWPGFPGNCFPALGMTFEQDFQTMLCLSLIHISEPTRLGMISYAVFC